MNAPSKPITLTVTRTISATPSQVFDVWIDPKSPGSPWFGTNRAIVDAKVDGLFYHSVNHEGRDWAHYGRFIRLDRGERIEHTWMSEATRGFETNVTITLENKGETSLVTLTHSNVPDDAMGRQHELGWGFLLDMLEKRFTKK